MPQREFANQKALIAYTEQNDLAYEYEYTPAFAKRQRPLSPEQYDIVEVRTSRGVSRVMLFSKAIIQAGIPQIRAGHSEAQTTASKLEAIKHSPSASSQRKPTGREREAFWENWIRSTEWGWLELYPELPHCLFLKKGGVVCDFRSPTPSVGV
jgi:hypothetical protein